MLEGILIFLAFVFLSASVVLGVKWRKEANKLLKEILKSKQNICMGLMLVVLAIVFFINATSTTGFNFRFIIAVLLLALGSFNTIQGIRMHKHYSNQKANV